MRRRRRTMGLGRFREVRETSEPRPESWGLGIGSSESHYSRSVFFRLSITRIPGEHRKFGMSLFPKFFRRNFLIDHKNVEISFYK
jgi:hypothetical protein